MRPSAPRLALTASLAVAAASLVVGVPAAATSGSAGSARSAELIHVTPVPATEDSGHDNLGDFATPDGTLYLRWRDGSARALPPGSDDLGPAVSSECTDIPGEIRTTGDIAVGTDGTVFASCRAYTHPFLHVVPADRSRPAWNLPGGTSDLHAAPDGSLYFRQGDSIVRLPPDGRVPEPVIADVDGSELVGVDRARHFYLADDTTVSEYVPGSSTPVRRLPGTSPVLVGDDGTVIAGNDTGLTRYEHGSSTGTALEGLEQYWNLALASDGYLAATGHRGNGSPLMAVWAPGAGAPEKVIPLATRPGAVAVAPGGAARASQMHFVESTTGRTTNLTPSAPHVLGWVEELGRPSDWYYRATPHFVVVPGDHPAIPIEYTLDKQVQAREALSRDVNAPLPAEKMLMRPVARTADGAVITGEVVVFSVTSVEEFPMQPDLAYGVPVLVPLLSGSPEDVRLVSGTLPPGTRVDGIGKLSGTPSQTGVFTFTLGYGRAGGLHPWAKPNPETVALTLSVVSIRTRVTVSAQPKAPGSWTLVSQAFGSDDQRAADRVDLQLLTGTSTFGNGLRHEIVRTKYWYFTGATELTTTGTEPVVVQARSGRSTPTRVVLRPPGAPTSGSDLWVHLDAAADVAPGGLLTVSLVAGNTGPDPATGVAALVQLPAGATFTGTTCGATDIGGGRLLLTKDGMASGQSVDCTLTVRAPQGTPGRSAAITAGITGLGHDPIPADDTARVTVSLRRP